MKAKPGGWQTEGRPGELRSDLEWEAAGLVAPFARRNGNERGDLPNVLATTSVELHRNSAHRNDRKENGAGSAMDRLGGLRQGNGTRVRITVAFVLAPVRLRTIASVDKNAGGAKRRQRCLHDKDTKKNEDAFPHELSAENRKRTSAIRLKYLTVERFFVNSAYSQRPALRFGPMLGADGASMR